MLKTKKAPNNTAKAARGDSTEILIRRSTTTLNVDALWKELPVNKFNCNINKQLTVWPIPLLFNSHNDLEFLEISDPYVTDTQTDRRVTTAVAALNA